MIIECGSCSRKFVVRDNDIPNEGRIVQCGYCSITWHQMPVSSPTKVEVKPIIAKNIAVTDESPSVDSIKASNGKTYRFLGNQWAELLPSGKTGLFARRKISQELDEITGRKEKKITRKKKKKLEEVDPSSESFDSEKRLPDVYKSKQELGFFGYVFLLVIIVFSVVGVLRTFEDNLLYYFPETESIFEFLTEQMTYVSETVKNMIVIINDLTNSY